MGSYASCNLGNLSIETFKGDIDIGILSLFRSNDKIVIESINQIDTLNSDYPEFYKDWYEDNRELKVVYYEAPLSIIKDRLNILGYNLKNAQDAFKSWVKEEQNQNLKNIDECSELLREHYIEENEVLQHLTPELWCECITKINNRKSRALYTDPIIGKTISYMTKDEHSYSESGWYGFPGYDLYVPLRLAIEALEDNKTLVYDLTQLIDAGYYEYDEDFIEDGLKISAMEYMDNSKTIILTEGKTDTWVLKETFDLLYPHLKDYFSFLDFESSKFGGGVGQLTNVVKAFSGAGIVNNVIALFDNDAAAKSACKALVKLNIPKNICIVYLPVLDLLKSYPTIGPSGSVNLDINGMAASIELYFGEDVLNDDGKLAVIQWTGYESSVNKYQGEVLDKDLLHKKFRKKLKEAKEGKYFEWKEIHEIFKVIFTAFDDVNRDLICKRPYDYYSSQ